MGDSRFPFAAAPIAPVRGSMSYQRGRAGKPEAYRDFTATELYCPKCRQAMAVREKMLLVLPDGDLFDYVCSKCGTSVGSRKA